MSSPDFLPSQENNDISDSTLPLFDGFETGCGSEACGSEAALKPAEAPLPEDEADEGEDLTESLFAEDRERETEKRLDLDGYAQEADKIRTAPERLYLFRGGGGGSADEGCGFYWPGKRRAAAAAEAAFKGEWLYLAGGSVNYPDSRNLCVEGDPLTALRALRERCAGQVRLLYLDLPPEGELPGLSLMLGSGDRSGGRGRGRQALYSQLYACLLAARELLEERGTAFICCRDSVLGAVMQLCSEVFADSFLGLFPRLTGRTGKAGVSINKCCDYILAYAKGPGYALNLPAVAEAGFSLRDEYFAERGFYRLNLTLDSSTLEYRAGLDYPLEIEGETFYPGSSYESYLLRRQGRHGRRDWAWRWSRRLVEFGLANGFIVLKRSGGRTRIYTKTYQRAAIKKTASGYAVECSPRTRPFSSLDFLDNRYGNLAAKKELDRLFKGRIMEYSKPVTLLKELLRLASDRDSTVLDICDKSGVLAQAVLELNLADGGERRFILCQPAEELPESSPAFQAGLKSRGELSRERIRRASEIIKEHNNFADAWSDMGFLVCKVE